MGATRIEIQGVNGQWITLSGEGQGEQGMWLSGESLSGIWSAPVKTIYNSHAFQVGSTYGGKRVLQRDMVLGIHIAADDWRATYDTLRAAVDFDRDAKLWVSDEDSRSHLKFRLGEHINLVTDIDPGVTGYALAVLTLVAGDPWYYGEDYTQTWVSPTDTTNGSTVTGSVTVSNPTDVPVWPVWQIQAPGRPTLPDFSWGDDRFGRAVVDAGRQITMPLMQSGEHVQVTTDPQSLGGQFQSSTDTAYYARMNGVRFCYPIPAGTPPTAVPVSMRNAPAGVGIRVVLARASTHPLGVQ